MAKVIRMNELLNHLIPIVPTQDNRNIAMIESFKKFFIEYDMDRLNDCSLSYFNDYTEYFFNNFPYQPNERHLNVIGAFLGWLGSNCGRAFINEANRLGILVQSAHKGYVYAWAAENQRLTGINSGITVLEYLLTPLEHHDAQLGLRTYCNQFVTSHDIETVNYFVHWLATAHGQAFLEPAFKEVSEIIDMNRNQAFTKIFA